MRYLKLASAENPYTDFIELNNLNGFLCTSFQTVGISRKLEYLSIKNRQFAVENKTNFKKYSLTIEILTKYSEYEEKHRDLITFLDRNKMNGLRLYYRPYEGMDLRYCLCDIETSSRPEKMQPVLLTLSQGSLWFGEDVVKQTSFYEEDAENLFVFKEDENIEDYYCASFSIDKEISNYYCVYFYNGFETSATIINNSYVEIPLNIKILGDCVNPVVSLFRKNEVEPIRQTMILANIDSDYYLEINSNIRENGVWYVNSKTKEKIDYTELVDNSLGSPYFYIDSGEYYITVRDANYNICVATISYKEEYSE